VRGEAERLEGWAVAEGFRFERIDAWRRTMAWTKHVYVATGRFAAKERMGLTSQLRRAAVSVPSNNAEGTGRISSVEFVRFLEIAYGSLMEAVCQCRLAADLGYLLESEHDSLRAEAEELARMLSGLRASRRESGERRSGS
jgi:four helix bundle protein